jgi:hypothetical protein
MKRISGTNRGIRSCSGPPDLWVESKEEILAEHIIFSVADMAVINSLIAKGSDSWI